MFTGIITNQGKVLKCKKNKESMRLRLGLKKKEKDLKLGESIAVNGVCLTVTKKSTTGFEVDVVFETLKATTLGDLRVGSKVNLERSLQFGDRMGGHFVMGHVDGVGILKFVKKLKDHEMWNIQAPKNVLDFVALKGSIAIDGISLTIQEVTKTSFKIALIPHTLKETNLTNKKEGDKLNLEIDVLARYGKLPGRKAPNKKALQKEQKNLQLQGF